MKLLRHGEPGCERPGLVDCDGQVRDLSSVLHDLNGDALGSNALGLLSALDPFDLPIVAPHTRLGPCIGGTRNFVAVGLNYADHAIEAGMSIPQQPIVFNKAVSCISGPNDSIFLPEGAIRVDWEIELALVIGRRTHQISEADAMNHLAGYCICNDLSERAWQLDSPGQWMKGKSAPSFGPLGPWLVTCDEVTDPLDLTLTLDVNGERMQTGSTSTMIFSPAFLVSYLSRFMVLEPGDVITTGTPPGVGMARNRYLASGDHIRLAISGLGEQAMEVR